MLFGSCEIASRSRFWSHGYQNRRRRDLYYNNNAHAGGQSTRTVCEVHFDCWSCRGSKSPVCIKLDFSRRLLSRILNMAPLNVRIQMTVSVSAKWLQASQDLLHAKWTILHKTHSAADRKMSQCYSGLHFCQLRLWQGITFNKSMLIASQRYPFTLIYSSTNCVELDARSREKMQATHGMRPLAYAWGLEQKVKLIITPWILTPWENRSDCMNMCHPLHSKRRLHRKECMTIGNRLAYLFAWKRPKNYIMECPFFTFLNIYVDILHWNKARNFL